MQRPSAGCLEFLNEGVHLGVMAPAVKASKTQTPRIVARFSLEREGKLQMRLIRRRFMAPCCPQSTLQDVQSAESALHYIFITLATALMMQIGAVYPRTASCPATRAPVRERRGRP